MLWLNVVEITDGATTSCMHADFVGAPPIDWFQMIELRILDKSESIILESCATRNEVWGKLS